MSCLHVCVLAGGAACMHALLYVVMLYVCASGPTVSEPRLGHLAVMYIYVRQHKWRHVCVT